MMCFRGEHRHQALDAWIDFLRSLDINVDMASPVEVDLQGGSEDLPTSIPILWDLSSPLSAHQPPPSAHQPAPASSSPNDASMPDA
eukprot:243509-Lingulodinium_polyedra.AAC.1